MKKWLLSAILAVCLFFPPLVQADLDPRDYIAAPPGTFAMIAYYRHITADKLYNDDNRISNNAGLTANVGIFRPVYYFDVGGFTADIQALIIVGDQEVDLLGESSSGFFDPVLLGTFWFISNAETKTWLGFTPYFSIPLGDYQEDKTVNNGTNRWAFKEELMLSKGFGNGWYLEGGGSVEFFTDNDDFAGNSELEQDPLWTAELHLSKDITKKWYVGGSYYFHYGGETKVDGNSQDDDQSNHTLMGTIVFGIDTNYNLQLQYLKDVSVESGFKRGAFQARFLYFF